MQSALDGLEPLSLGLIKFRTWHLRIRKNMKFKSQRPAGEDVWGGPAALLAPGQARSTRARIFSQRSPTNTNPIHRARPAGRPVGSACGFSSRTDAGQVQLESAVRGDSKQPSSRLRSRIWTSLRTPWQRVGAGGGVTPRLSASSCVHKLPRKN